MSGSSNKKTVIKFTEKGKLLMDRFEKGEIPLYHIYTRASKSSKNCKKTINLRNIFGKRSKQLDKFLRGYIFKLFSENLIFVGIDAFIFHLSTSFSNLELISQNKMNKFLTFNYNDGHTCAKDLFSIYESYYNTTINIIINELGNPSLCGFAQYFESPVFTFYDTRNNINEKVSYLMTSFGVIWKDYTFVKIENHHSWFKSLFIEIETTYQNYLLTTNLNECSMIDFLNSIEKNQYQNLSKHPIVILIGLINIINEKYKYNKHYYLIPLLDIKDLHIFNYTINSKLLSYMILLIFLIILGKVSSNTTNSRKMIHEHQELFHNILEEDLKVFNNDQKLKTFQVIFFFF